MANMEHKALVFWPVTPPWPLSRHSPPCTLPPHTPLYTQKSFIVSYWLHITFFLSLLYVLFLLSGESYTSLLSLPVMTSYSPFRTPGKPRRPCKCSHNMPSAFCPLSPNTAILSCTCHRLQASAGQGMCSAHLSGSYHPGVTLNQWGLGVAG